MKARRTVSLCLLVLLAASVPLLARGKKKIAVLDFDTSAVQTSVRKMFGQNYNVGGELSRQVEAYFEVDGLYRLVERKKIEKTLSHKKFRNLDYTKTANIRKLGKKLKADAVLVGRVLRFGEQTTRKRVRQKRRSRKKRRQKAQYVTLRKAVVEVEVRLVAVKSGKVLWVEKGIGKFTLAGKTAPLSGFEGFGAGGLDFARPDFLATPLGKAVDTAVDRVGTMVLDSRDDLGVKQFSITLSVSSVEGETAILNMGKGLGLKVGRRLPVRRTTGEVKDKKSGVVLKRDSRRVAVVEVVAFDDLTTTTRIISGEPVKVGDEVKVVMK